MSKLFVSSVIEERPITCAEHGELAKAWLGGPQIKMRCEVICGPELIGEHRHMRTHPPYPGINESPPYRHEHPVHHMHKMRWYNTDGLLVEEEPV